MSNFYICNLLAVLWFIAGAIININLIKKNQYFNIICCLWLINAMVQNFLGK
jgi:hypothetical protein